MMIQNEEREISLLLYIYKEGILLKLKSKLFTILILALGFSFIHLPVTASEFNFSVTTTPPKSQIDTEKTYFDIQLETGQQEDLKIDLRNDTDDQVLVGISVNSATTNSNVVVEYGENKIKKDDSLDFDLRDYVDYPETVTLPPKTTKTVVFDVSMPKKAFDGVLAGGITFKEIQEDQQNDDVDQGLSIQNVYSYVVALLMRQTTNEVAPNLILHEVEPGHINARNAILADLQNDKKTYINQVAIYTKITKKGSDEVLFQEEKDELQIAPNTNFSFPTLLNGALLEPGEYHFSMVVYGNVNENGKFNREVDNKIIKYDNRWELEKDFTIDGDVAKELNSKDVTIKNDYTWLYVVMGIIFTLVMSLLILFLSWRKKKIEEEV